MAGLARQFSKNLDLIMLARQIVQHVAGKNYLGEVQAVQQWVRANVRYTRDPVGVEVVADPISTIAMRAGDCDDQSVVVAALLMATGHRCRYVAVGATVESLCHVFTETLIGSKWVAVETTEPWPLGQRPDPRRYPASMVEHI